jgi:hypothetical protein
LQREILDNAAFNAPFLIEKRKGRISISMHAEEIAVQARVGRWGQMSMSIWQDRQWFLY